MPNVPYSRISRVCITTYFSNQISITAQAGAGSTTLLKNLQKNLPPAPWRWISGGSLMRAKAAELGMSIEEFARYNREHPEKGYDKWCDDTIEQLAKHNWVVVEGRLPHIFMPYAYRIKLVCSDEIRAVRRQAQEFPDLTFEEVLQRIKERDGNDNARYETLYPGCLWRDGDFDLVVNTERPTPEQTLYYVLREYESFIKSLTPNRILRAVKAPE